MSENISHGLKRKKKRTFLQKQARFGKQGRYGRGTNLNEDMYQYFLRILEVTNKTEKDSEEMEMLSSSLLKEIDGHEVEYSGNQLASRVIENLLPYAPSDDLNTFVEHFTEDLRPLFCDPFISHVLEALCIVAAQKHLKQANKEKEDEKIDMMYLNCVLKIGRFCSNNLEEHVWDNYGNHVLRCVLQCLSGQPGKEESEPGEVNQVQEFKDLLEEITTRLLLWPQFDELTKEELTSGLIQTVLVTNKTNPTITKKLIKRIIKSFKDITDLTNESQAVLRLVEIILALASEKYYMKLYGKFFKDQVGKLSMSRSCNFAVQKLFVHCPSKELYEMLFVEVSDCFNKILQVGNTGVLLSIAQGCHKNKAKQGDFEKIFAKLLNCYEPEERLLKLAPLACSLTTYDEMQEGALKVNLHGSLIVQEMLNFPKPIRTVNSILDMTDVALKELLCDPRGSHVADAFLLSPYVGEKSREKLFKKLQGKYSSLAISKHGSRALDTLWKVIALKQKLIVMEELKEKQTEVMASQSGRVIAYKLRLDYFRQNKEAWTKFASSEGKKDKFLSEIGPPKKKMKSE